MVSSVYIASFGVSSFLLIYYVLLRTIRPFSVRVAAALQVSLRTVYTIKDHVKQNPVLSSPGKKIYVIDEILRQHGHEVLRFPPYHCQFNAIELIWAKAKRYCDTLIGRSSYSDDSIKEMWNEALETCDKNTWDNCVRHTDTLIKQWYNPEKQFVNVDINPVIFNVNTNQTSESESDSD